MPRDTLNTVGSKTSMTHVYIVWNKRLNQIWSQNIYNSKVLTSWWEKKRCQQTWFCRTQYLEKNGISNVNIFIVHVPPTTTNWKEKIIYSKLNVGCITYFNSCVPKWSCEVLFCLKCGSTKAYKIHNNFTNLQMNPYDYLNRCIDVIILYTAKSDSLT